MFYNIYTYIHSAWCSTSLKCEISGLIPGPPPIYIFSHPPLIYLCRSGICQQKKQKKQKTKSGRIRGPLCLYLCLCLCLYVSICVSKCSMSVSICVYMGLHVYLNCPNLHECPCIEYIYICMFFNIYTYIYIYVF